MMHFTDNTVLNLTANLSAFLVCYWVCATALNVVVEQISMRRKV